MCSPSNVSSLYAVSLEVFFRNIDERKLERALIYCPVDTVFEIMWKVINTIVELELCTVQINSSVV